MNMLHRKQTASDNVIRFNKWPSFTETFFNSMFNTKDFVHIAPYLTFLQHCCFNGRLKKRKKSL